MTLMQGIATLGAAATIIVAMAWGVMRPPPLEHPLSQAMTESERQQAHRVFYKVVQPAFAVVLTFTVIFLVGALVIHLV